MGFAAIDFETANGNANSACQLGIVVVENWRIVAEHVWLIRPPRMFFSPFCVRVHGITARQCVDKPSWETLWPEIQSILTGKLILGHNVGFDAAVLLGCCLHYDLSIPRFELQCTRLISKKTWPASEGHGLAKVANRLGIRFKHHDALEDARASALVAIHAAQKLGIDSIESLEETLGIRRGTVWVDRVRNPRSIRLRRTDSPHEPPSRIEPKHYRDDGLPPRKTSNNKAHRLMEAILETCGQSKPLHGKSIVLVNSLLGLEKADAAGLLKSLGATVQSQINMQTQFVVVGTPEEATVSRVQVQQLGLFGDFPLDQESESIPKYQQEVEKRRELGQPIHILSQRQLLALIPSAAAIVRGS
jgi:DNA polymerase III subunit epsilon